MAGCIQISAAAMLFVLPALGPVDECAAENTSEKGGCGKKIQVGAVLPLSAGPMSSGLSVQRSIQLAGEKYDRSGCVEFLFEDDQLEPRKTVAAVKKLIEVDRVSGLIVYGTPTSLAVADYVEQRKLPMIAFSILRRVVENRRYIVKHWCTAERLDQAIIAEVKRRSYPTVAVASTFNDAMLGLRDLFVQSGTAKIVADDEFNKEDFDFRTAALKIKQKNPAAVYVLIYPPQTSPFVRALRTVGYGGEMFGVHNIEDPAEVAAAAGAMEGMWLANGDDAAGEGYAALYFERFNGKPPLGGANGFDAAKLFIEAAASGREINEYLHTVRNFSGAFGIYHASGSNDFTFPAAIKVVQGGSFEKP